MRSLRACTTSRWECGKPKHTRRFRWVVSLSSSILLTAYGLLLCAATPAFAATVDVGIDFGTATGLSTTDIREVVARIIRNILALLGIVALGIVLAGGFFWMTAGGNEDRVRKAKQLLANGTIGLAIILTSVSITQFVLSRLVAATTPGTVTTSTGGGGGGGTGLPGCTDPGGTNPFICSLSPASGPVGQYVTVRGYRFGLFVPGTSDLTIGNISAPIVNCGGAPNWNDQVIVAEVPQLAPGQTYNVFLRNGTSNAIPPANRITYGVLPGTASGPQVACVTPGTGPETTAVTIEGKQFGVAPGRIAFTQGVAATAAGANWTDTLIRTRVPAGAVTGDVTVAQGTATSNGYPFVVTCTTGAQCSTSNCCLANECYPANQCVGAGTGGVGASCNAGPGPACQPDAMRCNPGLSCDATSCTCAALPTTVGANCNTGPGPACQPGQCGGGLRCDATSCTCQLGVVITGVTPETLVDPATRRTFADRQSVPAGVQAITAPNGAVGNYVTITGQGFGTTPGTVTIGGVAAQPPPTCGAAWSDTQIIVTVPQGATTGPVRVATAGGADADQTDDTRGPTIPNFVVNTVQRPGICSLSAPNGRLGDPITVNGASFGATQGPTDGVYFAQVEASRAQTTWGAASIQTRVPNVAPGPLLVRVQVGNERSNAVRFTKDPEPNTPRVSSITPASGGARQYVTILGSNFGGNIGRVEFVQGVSTYNLVPTFPAQCTQSWWRDDQIIIRIPETPQEWGTPAPPNPVGAYQVRVVAQQAGGGSQTSNQVPFQVTAQPATPGICSIAPANGPVGTRVQLLGEGFGVTPGTLQFWQAQNGTLAAQSDWTPTQIDISVPAAAQTGPVRIWQQGENPAAPTATNRGSNTVQFSVQDCRQTGCSDTEQCCGDGTCIPQGRQCPAAGPNLGFYQWTFATGIIPQVPRVVERCDAAGNLYSPSPWDRQSQGTAVCVNANLSFRFTTSMGGGTQGTSVLTRPEVSQRMDVFRCTAGGNVAAAAGGFETAALPRWRIPGSGANPLQSTELDVAVQSGARVTARTGNGVLRLTKRNTTLANPLLLRAGALGVPNDATLDRHFYAIETPTTLIPDTDGTQYTARVYVRGVNPQNNPNMRAGLLVARRNDPPPAQAGWWQQQTSEVVIDGTWQELTTTITFDRGPNARNGAQLVPGVIRLYVTSPPAGNPPNPDDQYSVDFDDLSVTRLGDACQTRVQLGVGGEPLVGGVVVSNEPTARPPLTANTITIGPPAARWQPDTVYEVILYGDGVNQLPANRFPFLSLASAAQPTLRLDGDADGNEGGNYRFRFRTRANPQPCAFASIFTTPSAATLTQPGPTQATQLTTTATLPGLEHFLASGVSDANACFSLSAAGAGTWTWIAQQPPAPPAPQPQPPYAAVDTDGNGQWCATNADCVFQLCQTAADCLGSAACVGATAQAPGQCAYCGTGGAQNRCGAALNFTATSRAIAETPTTQAGVPRPVTLQTQVQQGTVRRTSTAGVTVRFAKPRVEDVMPTSGCQEACTNTRIHAFTNIDLNQNDFQVNGPNLVRLLPCGNESCNRAQLGAALGLPTVVACPQLPVANDPCANLRRGPQPQIVVVPSGTLTPSTSYRAVIRNTVRSATGVPLDNLNYDENGDGTVDAYAWTFRTGTGVCQVARIEVQPDPISFLAVGQRQVVSATPVAAANTCAPSGQSITAPGANWLWGVSDVSVAGFTRVTGAGAASTFTPSLPPSPASLTITAAQQSPACSLQCLRPGARRVTGICGNGALEAGEECEQTGGVFPSWCDGTTCLRRGASPTPNGTCGNGVPTDPGEECDLVDASGSPSRTGSMPPWCDPQTCLNRGAGAGGSLCGNGSVGNGEDCDDGNQTSGDGCSAACLWEGTQQAYNAATNPSGPAAVCGDGTVTFLGTPGPNTAVEQCEVCANGNAIVNGTCPGGAPATTRGAWETARCDFRRCVWLGNPDAGTGAGQCGNGTFDPGEECDDGAVGVCSAASPNPGAACSPANAVADCGAGGACVGAQPVDGDGCSSQCLWEGASLAHRNSVSGAPRPSMCGDGDIQPGETCDLGNRNGNPDASQILQAVGQSAGAGAASGTQQAMLTVSDQNVSGVTGTATVRLQCGFANDRSCNIPAAGLNDVTFGVDEGGCCARRPLAVVTTRSPAADATGACRNALVSVQFDQEISADSVGVVTDPVSGTTLQRGAVLELCTDATGATCGLTGAAWQVVTTADPHVIPRIVGGGATSQRVSELQFRLTSALLPKRWYRVRLVDARDEDALGGGQRVALRSTTNVRYHRGPAAAPQHQWRFQTGAQVCQLSRVAVNPSLRLLQRRADRADLRVTHYAQTASGEAPITSTAGVYAWANAWGSTDSAIVVPNATAAPLFPCGTANGCAFEPANPARNGEAFGRVTVQVTENATAPSCTPANAASVCRTGQTCGVVGQATVTPCATGQTCRCVGDTFQSDARLRVFLCENPWPAPNPATGTWQPWPVSDRVGTTPHTFEVENISLAYCRDQGTGLVCSNALTTPCAVGNERSICGNPTARCIADPSDDLPAFQAAVVDNIVNTQICRGAGLQETGSEQPCGPGNTCPVGFTCVPSNRDRLRRELLFLPRTTPTGAVYYCSVTGQRCDSILAGSCPAGEFCRPGRDAIGLRLFQNSSHVSAARWYQRQGFTEQPQATVVDGFRGVQAGRSTYVNTGNLVGTNAFTNVAVLSVNDGAVPETQAILDQVLAGMRFATNLGDVNPRTCVGFGRCTADNAPCRGAADCTGTNNTCSLASLVSCTKDLDCRVGATIATCGAPKDKFTRDVHRTEDLTEVDAALRSFAAGRSRCSNTPQSCVPNAPAGQPGSCPAGETCTIASPELTAGTFIPGMTTSLWPSWQQEFGKALGASLPTDPVNAFGGRCAPRSCGGTGILCPNGNADCARQPQGQQACQDDPRFDAQTCWGEAKQTYACPGNSLLYQYSRDASGRATLGGVLEQVGIAGSNWSPAIPATSSVQLTSVTATTAGICNGTAGRSYGVQGTCGDGILQAGEQCEPPGTIDTATRPRAGGGTESQTRTCQQNCQWSPFSAFTSTCGNFQLDPGEQCDAGPTGGRVQPAGGTVPGISAGTQYACSPTCTWAGGSCGDSVVQAGFGEDCDGGASTASRTPAASSAARQYACTPLTDTNPCRWSGGFCGDSVVQDGSAGVAAASPSTLITLPGRTSLGGTLFTPPPITPPPSAPASSETVCRMPNGIEFREACTGGSPCRTTGRCATRYGAANQGETCDGALVQSCIQGSDNLTPASIASPWSVSTINRRTAWVSFGSTTVASDLAFPVPILPQFSPGDVVLTIETANTNPSANARTSDLSQLDRSTIEASLPAGATIGDFNPLGARGRSGLYHRLRVLVDGTERGVVWALAADPSQPQTNDVVLRGIASGMRTVTLRWDNDWNNGLSGTSGQYLDSNLAIFRVAIAGIQQRSCSAPGTTNACSWSGAWGPCVAGSATCGNGQVDPGEECDDAGRGRCTDDVNRTCQRDSDCAQGAQCDENADTCTNQCRRNFCGDGSQLAPTCLSGDAGRIGQPCRSSTDCGSNGACGREECDTGASNWRAGVQCTAQSGTAAGTCVGGTNSGRACTSQAACGAGGRCVADRQCADTATCAYGRTCNYCLTGSCTITSRVGGFCGDGVVNGPEACDGGTPTNRRTAAQQNPTASLCTATCDQTCPNTRGNGTETGQLQLSQGGQVQASVSLLPGQRAALQFPAARIHTHLSVDVTLPQGIATVTLEVRDVGNGLIAQTTVQPTATQRPLTTRQRIALPTTGGSAISLAQSIPYALVYLRSTTIGTPPTQAIAIGAPSTEMCSWP